MQIISKLVLFGALLALPGAVWAQCCGGDQATTGGPVNPSGTRTITVTDRGFVPASINVETGKPVRLVFTRTTANTCATSVDLPDGSRLELPLNKPVSAMLTPPEAGAFGFACPMGMIRGTLVVR